MSLTADRHRRRRNWFSLGADAIACVVTPEPPADAYLCPLCLEFFTSEHLSAGAVTDEHVPPEGVGGKPLVLTCRSCNAMASKLDKAMSEQEKRRTWGSEHTTGPLPGSVTLKGVRAGNNGRIAFDGATFVMHGEPDQNNPETLAAHTQALERLGDGSVLTLRLPIKVWPQREALGWWRSAYLAAFAVYGYRYVLQPSFEPLRAAIADPDNTTFDPCIFATTRDGALDPLIGEITKPSWLAGAVAVFFGPRLILLPPWAAPADWFAGLRQRATGQVAENLTIKSAIGRRFPKRPMHLTDG